MKSFEKYNKFDPATSKMTSENRVISLWLSIGLVMIFLQIIIGGITRLTGSGLSITEWDIVLGTFPPLSEGAWQEAFDKYKLTPQYSKINADMEMGTLFTAGTFKFIYFWEYLHRLWARAMGIVFLVPFMYFKWRGWITSSLLRRLMVVIGLAALAATFGWIMVASGLIHRPWVNAYKLAIHLSIGISVFIALWWAYIHHSHRWDRPYRAATKMMIAHLVLIGVQIFLGGVMSGTKAALFINTWPDLNGSWIPEVLFDLSAWNSANFNDYEQSAFLVSLIQLLHRTVAYVILAVSIYVVYKYRYLKAVWIYAALLVLQICLGIATLIKSVGYIPVDLGVYHQGVAVLILASWIYVIQKYRHIEHPGVWLV